MDVSDDWQGWTIDAFADLIERVGPEPFLAAPTLEPTDACFPDILEEGPLGVRTLVRRMMRHAGLGDLFVDLQVVDEEVCLEAGEELRSPVVFVGIEGGAALFDLYELRSRAEMLGSLCFEVARAFRARHRLDEVHSPYRGDIAEDPGVVEQLAAVTAVYLGFGVLAANAAHSYEARGQMDGYMVSTEWRHTFAGGLPEEVLGWALAFRTLLRGKRGDRKAIIKHLSANPRAAFQEAQEAQETQEDLRDDREASLAKLGLPPESDWPAPREPDVAELLIEDADADLEGAERDLDEAVEEAEDENRRTRLVYGVRQKGVSPMLYVPLALFSLVVYIPAEGLTGTQTGGMIGAALFFAAAYLYLSTRVTVHCSGSECLSTIPREAARCPGCGYRVGKSVASRAEALDLPRYG